MTLEAQKQQQRRRRNDGLKQAAMDARLFVCASVSATDQGPDPSRPALSPRVINDCILAQANLVRIRG